MWKGKAWTSTKSIVEIISDFFRGSSRPDFNGEWVLHCDLGFLGRSWKFQRSGRHVVALFSI